MSRKPNACVFVAMSGGVDSSVAALLLKRAGYDVTGVFMKCYNLDGCAERDAEDARRVANTIGIPFYVWDFEKEYKKRVVEYMLAGYRKGITPNPDVMCNKEIKFGIFLKKALRAGADYVATGHYVRLKNARGEFALQMGLDGNKDQSYFLWTLTQDQLRYCLFPIGGLTKPEVRVLAKRAKLPTAEKKDSQGICFLGQISLFDFLKTRIHTKRGDIVTTDGEKIGEHEGAWFYTIGQRHGLHLDAKMHALGARGGDTRAHYVAAKDIRRNLVVVAEGADNPYLFEKTLRVVDVNLLPSLIAQLRVKKVVWVRARVRYRQPVGVATLRAHGKEYRLEFSKPQKFVAEGQSAVLYDAKGTLLGGGVIAS